MKVALITGVSGQGGSYLARTLLADGYKVVGTARNASETSYQNLAELGIKDQITIRSLDLEDAQSVLDLIDQLRPNEVYHLAAPSSVARSFIEPASTISSIALTTANVLEAIRKTDRDIPCFIASSTEVFGNCAQPATASTAHNPHSPYGIGKSCAQQQAKVYREAYGLFVCTGILSNFESMLRPKNYVTSKIVNSACEIALGNTDKIELGNTSIVRDWGAADDMMRAVSLSLKQPHPGDHLIATGKSHSLNDFLEIAFSCLGLDYKEHLVSKGFLIRPFDIKQTRCDISKTQTNLNWSPRKSLRDVITEMLYAELKKNVGSSKASALLQLDRTSTQNNVLSVDFKSS